MSLSKILALCGFLLAFFALIGVGTTIPVLPVAVALVAGAVLVQ